MLGTHAVLAAARRYRCRTLIASTSEVYGKNPREKWDEEESLVFGPTSRLRWSYGVAKAMDFDKSNWAETEYQKSVEERIGKLTPRELEVLQLLVKGHPSKVIAMELNLSQRTVDIYRGNVMQKMQTRSVATLVQMVGNPQL